MSSNSIRPRCLACGAEMQRMYVRTSDGGRRYWDGVAWLCRNPRCGYVMKDADA